MDPSASTTNDSNDTPEMSPSKLECHTPTFKEGSKRDTMSSTASQNPYVSRLSENQTDDKSQPKFSLLKQLFAGPEERIDEVRETPPNDNSPTLWKRLPELLTSITHECFSDEKHTMFCLDCKEFVCELCYL